MKHEQLIEPDKLVTEIASLIDDATLSALDVKPRSLRLAKQRGKFPASWTPVIRGLCERAGLPCPDEIFTYKASS